MALSAVGKPIEHGDSDRAEVNLRLIDLALKELELSVTLIVGDVDPPGARLAVRSIVPSIATCLEDIAEFEWGLLGLDAPARLACPCKKR